MGAEREETLGADYNVGVLELVACECAGLVDFHAVDGDYGAMHRAF